MLKIVFALLAFGISGAALAADDADAADKGVAAYRAGDFRQAKDLLTLAAAAGDARAARYVAYILLDANAGAMFDPAKGVSLLTEAAKAGDYAALIKLEELRRQGLAHSPSLADMIEIETYRAKAGDPVAAFRLARRYDEGDGVEPSTEEAMRWFEVAAEAPMSEFPKSADAAYRLCELYAREDVAADLRRARRWCGRAAENGNAAAAMALGRLAQAN